MAARKTSQRRNARLRKSVRDTRVGPEDQTILLGFRIEGGFVNLISRLGKNIPLFPAKRLSKNDTSDSLRTAIATLMQDE